MLGNGHWNQKDLGFSPALLGVYLSHIFSIMPPISNTRITTEPSTGVAPCIQFLSACALVGTYALHGSFHHKCLHHLGCPVRRAHLLNTVTPIWSLIQPIFTECLLSLRHRILCKYTELVLCKEKSLAMKLFLFGKF